MKIFIYKLLISLVAFYILFELTIGTRIDYFTDLVNSFKNIDQRIIIKEKLKDEMRKGIQKERYFDEEESVLISQFLKKILKELDLINN